MIPDWCKKAAIELRFPPEKWAEQPRLSTSEQKWIDEDAAIIAKHAPEFSPTLVITAEEHAQVRELVEAAREAMRAEHSHNRDKFAHLRRALEPFNE